MCFATDCQKWKKHYGGARESIHYLKDTDERKVWETLE